MFEIWIFGTARRPKIEAPDQQCSLEHKNSQNQEQHTAFLQENCDDGKRFHLPSLTCDPTNAKDLRRTPIKVSLQ
jgi:hypothetical protein